MTTAQPAPIGAASRDIDDRLGEVLCRLIYPKDRSMWTDISEHRRQGWRAYASYIRLTVFKEVGLRVEVAD